MSRRIVPLLLTALAVAGGTGLVAGSAIAGGRHHRSGSEAGKFERGGRSATPIRHVVVIFQENVSFDHHFGS